MKANHKYRATIYLGKERWTQLSAMGTELELSVATLLRAIIDMGFAYEEMLQNQITENATKQGDKQNEQSN